MLNLFKPTKTLIVFLLPVLLFALLQIPAVSNSAALWEPLLILLLPFIVLGKAIGNTAIGGLHWKGTYYDIGLFFVGLLYVACLLGVSFLQRKYPVLNKIRFSVLALLVAYAAFFLISLLDPDNIWFRH